MTVAIANLFALLIMPSLLSGVISRVKALWSGRRGPPLLQPAYDVLRLLRKSPVYSSTATPLFRIAPWGFLVTALGSAAVTPLLGLPPLIAFPFDFVWLMYVWALGRMALMLAALDTGSAFEGLGASREATFSTLLEPALFLALAALCLSTRSRTLYGALGLPPHAGAAEYVLWLAALVTLFIVLQVETARLPIDDPTTHLELTMVHEVMVLDHSGPDLAAVQQGSAIKLYVCIALLAKLLNPFSGPAAVFFQLAGCLIVAVLVGTIESLIARFRLRSVPAYTALALASAAVALLATGWPSRDGL